MLYDAVAVASALLSTQRRSQGRRHSEIWALGVLPNGARLSCGALKKDSFLNVRAPPASSAG